MPGGAAIGVPLIGAGVAHFGATYAEYTKTGDWNAASNNAGISFSTTIKTDWGYGDSKDKQNGITQNANFIDPKSDNNDFDFKAANNIGDTRPLIQQYSEHPGVSYQEYDPMGGILTTMATGLALSDYKMFNKDTWYSIKKMKTYSQSFNGNGYTGGKIASASRISTGFKIAGYGLGTYNAWSINKQYNNGELGTSGMVIEQSSNLYSTFGGTYGVAWGIGWEGGRTITKTIWYQDWKNNYWYPFREEHLGY